MPQLEDLRDGLEGVVAFATEIAEPDRDGGALRYRGVDIEELVGKVPFEQVWGLLVDSHPDHPLTPVGQTPPTTATGDVRVDLQAGLAALAPVHDFKPLLDTDPWTARVHLALASATALELVSHGARQLTALADTKADTQDLTGASTLAERFLLIAQGQSDPRRARALDAYWVTAAEHGINASTLTARVIASTGADIGAALSGAVGALSGPLHGGAPARVLKMLDEVEHEGDADRYVKSQLDHGQRLMGFGHRIYRAEDPRARALRRVAKSLGSPRMQVALELERAALAELAARKPSRPLLTNVEFWAAVVLDFAGVPQNLMPTMFACSRTAGWSAHILEQRLTGRLIRPTSVYVGPGPRPLESVL